MWAASGSSSVRRRTREAGPVSRSIGRSNGKILLPGSTSKIRTSICFRKCAGRFLSFGLLRRQTNSARSNIASRTAISSSRSRRSSPGVRLPAVEAASRKRSPSNLRLKKRSHLTFMRESRVYPAVRPLVQVRGDEAYRLLVCAAIAGTVKSARPRLRAARDRWGIRAAKRREWVAARPFEAGQPPAHRRERRA